MAKKLSTKKTGKDDAPTARRRPVARKKASARASSAAPPPGALSLPNPYPDSRSIGHAAANAAERKQARRVVTTLFENLGIDIEIITRVETPEPGWEIESRS